MDPVKYQIKEGEEEEEGERGRERGREREREREKQKERKKKLLLGKKIENGGKKRKKGKKEGRITKKHPTSAILIALYPRNGFDDIFVARFTGTLFETT